MQISETRARALEAFVGPHNADVIPHQPPDFVPVVVNHHQLIHVGRVTAFPIGQFDFVGANMRNRIVPNDVIARAVRHHNRLK